MLLSRHSKIKDVWKHPVGHAMLRKMLRQTGRSEKWLQGVLVSNLPLYGIDRWAGAGFCDMLLEMAANEPENRAGVASQDKTWWKEAVIYQIFVPSFMDADHDGVGDIAGVVQRLPYLQRLGVNVLWLWALPCEGIDGREMEEPLPCPDENKLEELVYLAQQAHSRGMRIMLGLDIAYTSDKHPWFKQALQGQLPGMYVLKNGDKTLPPNNWAQENGESAWQWYADAGVWALHLCGCHSMDLNWEQPSTRQRVAERLKQWHMAGVDGFFLGPVHFLNKGTLENGSNSPAALGEGCGYEKFAYGPRLHRYLQELREALPPEVLLAGEVRYAGTELARCFCEKERGELDMVLDAEFLLPWIERRSKRKAEDAQLKLSELKAHYLHWMERYAASCWMPLFLNTPYVPRMVGRLGTSPLYRATLAKLLATMMLTLRGTPAVYQGEELGLTNTHFNNPGELRDTSSLHHLAQYKETMDENAAFRRVVNCAADHARVPMPWGTGPQAGFTGAQPWMRLPDGAEYLNASLQMEEKDSVWKHYQQLIALRRASACLVYGEFNPVFVKNKHVFCYFRIYEGEKWYVEMNMTDREISRPGHILPSQKLVLSNYDNPTERLRPYEANLYRCD